MSENNEAEFRFPAVCRKKVTASFDGGRLISDGGVLLLGQIERHLGLGVRLAKCIEDPRDPAAVGHSIAEMIRFRGLLIAAATPTTTTATRCVAILPSRWHAAACRTAAAICVRSRP
jgi:hypothetical protein